MCSVDPRLQCPGSRFCSVLCRPPSLPPFFCTDLSLLGGVWVLRFQGEAHLRVIYLWKTSTLMDLWLLLHGAVSSFYRMNLLSNKITFPRKTCSFSFFSPPPPGHSYSGYSSSTARGNVLDPDSFREAGTNVLSDCQCLPRWVPSGK